MRNRSYIQLSVFLALVVLVGAACICGAPTLTTPSTPSAPSQPQSTQPPVQSTQPPVQPSSAKDFFTEDFNGDISSNWSKSIELNSTAGDKSQAQVNVKDGYLVFDLGKQLIAYMFYNGFEYDNVRIDARVDNRGTNINDVLLVCRASDEGHYLVNVANSGLFSIYAYDGAKKSYARIADGGSNKIKSGKEVNDYSLVCNDRTLIFYINGTEARRYTDNQFVFRKGKVAVGVASEDQIPVKVEFDWVKISQP
jgi:hypothetical protein